MSENVEAPTAEEGPLEAPRPRRRWRTIALGLAILVCGMVIGSGLTIVFGRQMALARLTRPRPPEAMRQRLTADLDLTPEQAEQVKQITQQHMQRVSEARSEMRAEFRAMRDEVEKVLTEEQAQAWRKKFERMGRPGGPRGPHGRGSGRQGPRHGRSDRPPKAEPADKPGAAEGSQ